MSIDVKVPTSTDRFRDGRVEAEARDAASRQLPRVSLSTPGTFHTFDMARQLEAMGMLASIHTGYPRFKLGATGLPAGKIRTFPLLKVPYLAGWVPRQLRREWEYWDRTSFDVYVSATLPECDVFCGLSGAGLRTGRLAKSRGARYVCDRGSSHIRYQDSILREEYERWGIAFQGVDPRTIADESAEYELADAILVPSTFAYRSFVEMGAAPGKLCLAPYGVDLVRFAAVGHPASDHFDALFVGGLSVRKGAGYLFAAFEKLQHPRKSLSIAGIVSKEITPALDRFMSRNSCVKILGHVPQAELKTVMSRSHILVLPSIEEGFGLVQAQAMACGCPVIASRNTGAEDLFSDGEEGFIIPARDTDALAAAMQRLADDPELRNRMSVASVQRVAESGGWDEYGRKVKSVFSKLVSNPSRFDGAGTAAS